jgi:hypothetical protein
VYAMMEGAGYISSFKACNQREVGVTHHNHLDEDVGGTPAYRLSRVDLAFLHGLFLFLVVVQWTSFS